MVKANLFKAALIAVFCASASEIVPGDGGLTVHEWGTFTSMADEAGNPVEWLPLAAPSDLPCFVHRMDGLNVKLIRPATVRMETPVLYFYSAQPVTADVKVNFPGGMITEWYPQAKIQPTGSATHRIEWDSVELSRAVLPLPREAGPSHYYAARETDGMMAETRGEREKMIFYRGIGNLAIPLHPRVTPEGQVRVEDPRAIVFENRGGKSNADAVRGELETALIESGLYPKEARAMIETWRDSWFEEGLRVFYIVPRARVDFDLPLSISPRPEKLVRTFVGRIELLAPWMRQQLVAEMRSGDFNALGRRGRFLDGFLAQIHGEDRAPGTTAWVQAKTWEGTRRFLSGECGQ